MWQGIELKFTEPAEGRMPTLRCVANRIDAVHALRICTACRHRSGLEAHNIGGGCASSETLNPESQTLNLLKFSTQVEAV